MYALSNDIIGNRRRRRHHHHCCGRWNCNRYRYAYNLKVLMIICVLLLNRCGFVKTIETTSIRNINGHTKSAASQTRSIILPSSPLKQQPPQPHQQPQQQQQQHQPKPSSVIYIPSLDDVNMASRLHSSEHDIRFEDFFWNGSGDGEPLILSLKSNARLTAMSGFVGRETFVKTATVIATVYIDDSDEHENDPNCKWPDCDDDINGIPDIYLPPNKRFWLVTTVFGHLADDDIPSLQQQLADIYRIAFTKQQSLHLGISNATTVDGSNIANDTTSIIESKQSTNLSMPISPTSVLKYEYGRSNSNASIFTSEQPNLPINSTTTTTTTTLSLLLPSESGTNITLNSIKTMQNRMVSTKNANQIDSHQNKEFASSIPFALNIVTTNATAIDTTNTAIATSTMQPKQIILQSTINASKPMESHKMHRNIKSTLTAMKNAEHMHRSDTTTFIGHINVLIHNISVINSSDKDDFDKSEIREWMSTTAQSNGGSGASNFSSDSLQTNDNQTQTEIIYTVFVNGMPVLAKIAANDMQLMSDTEVSGILDMDVHIKAEPYLKEPQATPLIPSSTVASDQNKPILAIIFQNPYILAFILSLILLVILLLMLLMLVTGTKNQQRIPKKGLTTTAAQTARQPPNLPAVPSKKRHSSGHISLADESHQYRANITNELLMRQSGNNMQPQQQQQQQEEQQQQQQQHHHHQTNQKRKQAGTQITSLHDTVDGFAYDDRDHSFIIIPTPLKRRHNKKSGAPTIYFPEPPSSEPSLPPSPSQSQHTFGTLHSGSRSRSCSSSNTSTTSDTSSIYYIKTHKSRRHHLYAKRPKHITAVNQREYATITKKQIERAQKKSKHKHRKYLTGVGNGNRVGAFEAAIVQVHSSRSSSMATAAAAVAAAAAATSGPNANEECHRVRGSLDENSDMSMGKDSNLYEHIEAFNPMVGKKNIHNQFMSTRQQQQIDHGKKSSTIFNENEKHMQSKSHLIDRRQNENDNVNHLRNGTNSFMVVNAASDKSQQQPKLKLQKSNSSNNEVIVVAAAVAADAADIQPSSETKNSSNLCDERIKMKTDRISNQLSTDGKHDGNNDDSDVGSVGSFLSMVSVRSFPKCSVPEPLNRVLEPVSITYLDQYDEIEATEAATSASKLPRIVDAKAKKSSTSSSTKPQSRFKPQPQPSQPLLPPTPPPPVRSCKQHEHTGTKQSNNSDEIVYLSRTRSDHHDPGVVGPIAWQYHKKRLEDQQNAKLHIDPMCTQHRYEDLVEGAISLYSIETTEYHTIETITKEGLPEVLIGPKDMRGKSADIFPTPMSAQAKTSPKPYRPFTAVPSKAAVASTEEPQITSKDAWAGSTSMHQSPNSDVISTQSDGEAINSGPHSKPAEKH